ncbi:MAG: 16S rRNA (cytosine(1402)-N(4))-methyltransferase RsmH [Bacteroidota bacterium]
MMKHLPVLLNESIEGLDIKPDGIYVDLTFGGGGHSREIIKRLENGRLIAFDVDEEAQKHLINDDRFVFHHANYAFFKNFLMMEGIDLVDGVLADLGVSAFHLDDASRGFVFREDCRLDMRMNTNQDLDAEKLVNEYSPEQLKIMFREYGDLPVAGKLAHSICAQRKLKRISTSAELVEAIGKLIPKGSENKFLARVFQSIRIEVNREKEGLMEMLTMAAGVIRPGGRLVVISYHSVEDRIVKNFIRAGNFTGREDKDFFGNISRPFEEVNRKVIIPGENELKINNRARSAKMRIAAKTK